MNSPQTTAIAASQERPGSAYNGYVMLLVLLGLVIGLPALFFGFGPKVGAVILPLLVLGVLSFLMILNGFFMIHNGLSIT